MKRHFQNFDYYSKYLGETGLTFIAYSKENESFQTEYRSYSFTMWEGYSNNLFLKLTKSSDYIDLPLFVKNWNECKGWRWDDIPDKINEMEIDWLLAKLPKIKFETENSPEKVYFDFLPDFIFFIESVKDLNLELKISDDY